MFPQTEPNPEQRLCELKIVTVKCTLEGVIKEFVCEDEHQEVHSVKFVDGALLVDDEVTIKTVQKTYAEDICASCRG